VANSKNAEGLVPASKGELMIEEFSIVELEDRLEFLDRCNSNCSCPGPKPVDPVPVDGGI
jgi:hypothetical protein